MLHDGLLLVDGELLVRGFAVVPHGDVFYGIEGHLVEGRHVQLQGIAHVNLAYVQFVQVLLERGVALLDLHTRDGVLVERAGRVQASEEKADSGLEEYHEFGRVGLTLGLEGA